MLKKLTPEDFLYFEEQVIKFNELLGNDISDKSLSPTYQGLTEEEFNELKVAVEEGNEVEELDAIIDLIFVNFYSAILEGDPLKEWVDWLDIVCNDKDIKLLCGTDILEDNLRKPVYIFQTVLVGYIISNQHRFDIRGAFERVLESNLSKAIKITNDIDIQKYVDEVISKGRYKGVDYREVNGYYVITATEDVQEGRIYSSPKVVKGSWYSSVEDLGGLEEFIL